MQISGGVETNKRKTTKPVQETLRKEELERGGRNV